MGKVKVKPLGIILEIVLYVKEITIHLFASIDGEDVFYVVELVIPNPSVPNSQTILLFLVLTYSPTTANPTIVPTRPIHHNYYS